MLNDQLYKFYNLDFRILMTSRENDLLVDMAMRASAQKSNIHVVTIPLYNTVLFSLSISAGHTWYLITPLLSSELYDLL